ASCSISLRSASGWAATVTRSGMSALASASRICTRRPAARAWALSASRRGQLSRQPTVAAALSRQSFAPRRTKRSDDSLGNHSEMMRFIVPLQEPGGHLLDRRRAEAIAPELDLPAYGAQHLDARHFDRRRGGNAPARRAHALRRRRLGTQQQGRHAVLLGGERESPAGGRIGGAGLAHDRGDARRTQAFLHCPEEIFLAP